MDRDLTTARELAGQACCDWACFDWAWQHLTELDVQHLPTLAGALLELLPWLEGVELRRARALHQRCCELH